MLLYKCMYIYVISKITMCYCLCLIHIETIIVSNHSSAKYVHVILIFSTALLPLSIVYKLRNSSQRIYPGHLPGFNAVLPIVKLVNMIRFVRIAFALKIITALVNAIAQSKSSSLGTECSVCEDIWQTYSNMYPCKLDDP